jgi:translation initiation factor 2B subunit (eIF-2B alpha/beta/delta family)
MIDQYINQLLEKYNVDPDDETFTIAERVLLKKIVKVEQTATDIIEQIKDVEKEINETQQKLTTLNSNLLHTKGQSKGLLEALLSLKEDD